MQPIPPAVSHHVKLKSITKNSPAARKKMNLILSEAVPFTFNKGLTKYSLICRMDF